MNTPFEGDEITRVLDRVVEFSAHLEYGLVEAPEGWIEDPYTRDEYRADRDSAENSD